MSLIEKIDKRIEYYRGFHSDRFHAKADGLEQARKIILSEQKEPCELCNWFKGMKAPIPEIESELGEEITYKSKEINCCPNCGRQLIHRHD